MLRLSTATLLRRTTVAKIICPFSTSTTATGTVKFFDRQKAFGFIIADEDAGVEGDVYVRRSRIVGASEEIPDSPSLTKDERVRFEVSTNENGKPVAHNVTREDGKKIRIYTPEITASMKNRLKSQMGPAIFGILDDDALGDEEKLDKVMEKYQATKARVAEIDAKQAAEEQEEKDGAI